MYESSCSTKYRQAGEEEGEAANQGKFLADTSCEKLPVKICGAGCSYVDGDEECHDKVITTIVNVPEARLGCIFSNTFLLRRGFLKSDSLVRWEIGLSEIIYSNILISLDWCQYTALALGDL